MRVELRAEYEAELFNAADWYESHTEGVGAELLAEARRALLLIEEAPGRYPLYPGSSRYRRVRLSRFPYQVIYLDLADKIVVLAFAHEHQKPGYWAHRRHGDSE